jgi:hypothetical protein
MMNKNMLFAPLTLSPLLYNTIEDMKAKIRKITIPWHREFRFPKRAGMPFLLAEM